MATTVALARPSPSGSLVVVVVVVVLSSSLAFGRRRAC
jgi:hypothetical protein